MNEYIKPVELTPDLINTVKIESMTNFSQVLGIATAVARKQITGYFNDGFFKHERIGTNLQSVSERFTKFNNDKLARKQNPALSLKIEYNPKEALRNDAAFPGNYYAVGGGVISPTEFLFPLYNNDAHDDLRYELKRTTISFTVGIRVGTQLEAWNVGEYLASKLRANRNFYLQNQMVHSIIPDALIAKICKINKINWNNTEAILKHLRQFSQNEINVIHYGGTNSRKFTFGKSLDFQFEINTVPSISTNRRGRAELNSLVTFNFDLHFSYPCAFVLSTQPVILNEPDPLDKVINNHMSDEGGVIHLNIPGMNFAPREYLNGKYRFVFTKFSPELNTPVEHIKFKECLAPEIIGFIDNLLSTGIDPDNVIDFYMFNGDSPLHPDAFFVDWTTYQVLLESPVINDVYAFGIYINREEFYSTN